MKIKFKIKAFTVVEALVCFAIMGMLFVATLSTIKRNDNYDKLYWQAFNTLYQASKAASAKFENEYKSENLKIWNADKGDNIYDKKNSEDGTPNLRRKYPGFLKEMNENNKGSAEGFCLRLTEYINTLNPEISCRGEETFKPNSILREKGGKVGVNFYKGYSAVEPGEGETYDAVGEIQPSFTTLNGQKFYIFPILTANYRPGVTGDTKTPFDIKERESFRFVVVDLNGDEGPNTQFIKGGHNPDLVLFAIDSEGNVIPLGLPEWSKAYINAVVTYPNYLKRDGQPAYPKVHSRVDTLWNSKFRAWGGKDCSSDSARYGQSISQHEALSQSTKFYFNAASCMNHSSADYCANRNSAYKYVDEEYVYLVTQFLYKEEGSSDYLDFLTESRVCNETTTIDEENGCVTVTDKDMAPTCGIDFKH